MNESYQNFNYHTHTKRCSHAGNYEDAEYVYYARLNGISTVGFTDHVPFNPIKLPDIKSRMVYSEVDEYISSINALKKENPDMCILSGFEAEYYPEIEEFLGELRSKVDYMIMGEHFFEGVEVNNKDYPLIYADMVVKGIESGIFDIIAHPDIFIRKRNSISSEEDMRVFDENTIRAGKIIATKAKEYNIPLELNVKYSLELGSEIIPFWKQVSQINTKVLFGLDAHDPKAFNEFYLKRQVLLSMLNMKFNFVNKDYNPIVARLQNQRLNLNYQIRQSKALCVQTSYASKLLECIFDRIPKFESTEEVSYYLNEHLTKELDDIAKEGTKKDEESFSRIEELSSSNTEPYLKSYLLRRVKMELATTNQVIASQINLVNTIKKSIDNAFLMGASSKEEVMDIVTKLIELTYTKNTSKKRVISEYLESLENNLGGKSTGSKLVRVNPLGSTNEKSEEYNKWNGFVSKFSLLLLVAFLIGFGIGIAYMFIKII